MDGHQVEHTRVHSIPFSLDAEIDIHPEQESLVRFEEAWAHCAPIIRGVLDSQSARVLKQAAHFLATSEIPEQKHFGLLSTLHAVPTATILGGTSATLVSECWPNDHQLPIVASLHARDAPNIRTALRALTTRLIAYGRGPDVGTSASVKGKKPSMLSEDSFDLFKVWYGQEGQGRKVVVALDDFEAFDPTLINDLIYILTSYRAQLPIVLLLSLQTSIDAINVLSYTLKPLLRIQTFIMVAGETSLIELVQSVSTFDLFYPTIFPPRLTDEDGDQLFVDRIMPLGITDRVLDAIRDQYHDADGSVVNAVAKLRHAFLLHFTSCPASVYTLSTPYSSIPSDEHAHLLRKLPSFRQHAERMLNGSLESDHLFISAGDSDEAILELLRLARMQRVQFEHKRRTAHIVYRELCRALGLKSASGPGEDIDQLLSGTLLGPGLERLKTFRNATCGTFHSVFSALQEALEEDDTETDVRQVANEQLRRLGSMYESFEAGRRSGEVQTQELKNTHQLKQLGGGGRMGLDVRTTPLDEFFTAQVQEVTDFFEELFTLGFRHPTELLFHELWYIDQVDEMEQAFVPRMLASAESALMLDDYNNASTALPEDVLASLASTDTSVAYRLFRDAGKLVNLADWYGSFCVARPLPSSDANKTPGKKGRRGTKRKQIDEEQARDAEEQETQRKARFIRSVSDLAWMGMLHGTKRRGEHVAKLVF